MARELRIEISDEAYEALQHAAAARHVAAEDYAEQILDADLTRARFLDGARSVIAEHGDAFTARYGRPAAPSTSAA
ncbi:hypothetical protein [Streptomyces sp. NPDC093105]|uniref:hypothetical protein n=1 Tax=Streptomyces sp. NPDC093105 TaxID=3366029 RepID=UPI0037F1944A